jgi:hypothetical protein
MEKRRARAELSQKKEIIKERGRLPSKCGWMKSEKDCGKDQEDFKKD